jgi:hypothetical protein
MKNFGFALALALALALVAWTSSSNAQVRVSDRGGQRALYFGYGWGLMSYRATHTIDLAHIDTVVANRVALRVNETVRSAQLFGGFDFTRHLGVELGTSSVHIPGAEDTLQERFRAGVPSVLYSGDVDLNLVAKYEIYTVKLRGLVPLDIGTFFGALGFYDAAVSGEVQAPGFFELDHFLVGSTRSDETGLIAAVGVEFGGAVRIRAEYERFDSALGRDLSTLRLGVLARRQR